MAEIGYTNAFLQYWFIFIALIGGIIAIIIFNIAAYCYFSKRSPVDPLKIIPELEAEEQRRKEIKKQNLLEAKQRATFTNAFPRGELTSPDPRKVGKALTQEEDVDIQQFRIDSLASHNIYREKHGAEALQYCESLSIYAQYWAEHLAKIGKIIHSPMEWRLKYNSEPIGENIVSTNAFKITGKGLSDMWYSESFKHKYGDSEQPETKSFTQMIWNDSKQVGFGRAKGPDMNWYGVAMYYPAGNLPGEYRDNVFEITDQQV